MACRSKPVKRWARNVQPWTTPSFAAIESISDKKPYKSTGSASSGMAPGQFPGLAVGWSRLQGGCYWTTEPFAKFSAGTGFVGRERGQENSRGRSALCLNPPQEAQKLESAGLKSHALGIKVPKTRLSVEQAGHKRHKTSSGLGKTGALFCELLCFLWLSRLPHSLGSGSFPGRSRGRGHSRGKSALCCFDGDGFDSEFCKRLQSIVERSPKLVLG